MQPAITFIAVVAGLLLSLAVALLAEELIFGQVMRLFFVREAGVHADSRRQTVPTKTEGKREARGERQCLR